MEKEGTIRSGMASETDLQKSAKFNSQTALAHGCQTNAEHSYQYVPYYN